MKHILLTGVNSYIGNAVERYLTQYNAAQGRELYRVSKVSLRDEGWQTQELSSFDTVIHVAGKAHADISHVSEETKQEYYRVNCGLTEALARRVKEAGVPQFIYLSSVIVYGDSVKNRKHITSDTQPAPTSFYGDSKLAAEEKLRALADGHFQVAVLRLPMVYGQGSKGNFPLLKKLAEKTPVFPRFANERSMLYVENLTEFLRLLTDSGRGGLFVPQNKEYVTTAQMVKLIARAKGKKLHLLGMLNPFVKLALHMPGKVSALAGKAFGSFTVDQAMNGTELGDYRVYDLEESVRRSV